MDIFVKTAVAFTILSYATTARSYHGYYNKRIEKQHDFEDPNQWNDGPHWKHHGHIPTDFDHSSEDFDYPHKHSTHNNFNRPTRDFGHAQHNFGHEHHDFGHAQHNFGHEHHDFGHQGHGCDQSQHNQPQKGSEGIDPEWYNNYSTEDYDYWGFPDFTEKATQPPTQPRTTPTTPSPIQIQQCMRACPVTSEYNPVCGSNDITYNNPGRLECARNCGVDVTLKRASACPPPTPPPETGSNQPTPAPVNGNGLVTRPIPEITPTRFTTIEVNPGNTPDTSKPVTIPSSVLDMIFSKPDTPVTNDNVDIDENVDIDIRTRTANNDDSN